MTPGGNRRRKGLFPELLAPLQALAVPGRVRVAVSGGLDSMVLLHLAHQVFGHRAATLSAIHVNHQLQPAAPEFESACREACESLTVPLEVVPVNVGTGRGSVESAAREARYRVFKESMAPGDVLLMAHHGDDQSETLLFRFLRGTGVKGLAGVPAERALGRGRLVRPLLGFSREQLKQQASAAGIEWVEDPTNEGTEFDRNYLRHRIMPGLKERWPELGSRLSATARACGEAAELAELLALSHFQQLSDGPDRICLDGLRTLPLAARRNLLQWWLGESLDRSLSDQELADLLLASDDASPEIRAGAIALRRFRRHIYRAGPTSPPLAEDQLLAPGKVVRDGHFTVCIRGAEPHPGNEFRLTHRHGGERLRERAGGPSRLLKKWLQEQGVPPWERDRLPLVFRGEELVAVADLWLSPSLCGPDGAGVWQLEIRREQNDSSREL